MTTVDYQPWYTTNTYPSLAIPLNVTGAPDNITGISSGQFTMIFRTSAGTDTTGTGSFAIETASPAVIAYTFSTADVSSAFTGSLIVKAVFPGGGIAVYDAIPFTVTAV